MANSTILPITLSSGYAYVQGVDSQGNVISGNPALSAVAPFVNPGTYSFQWGGGSGSAWLEYSDGHRWYQLSGSVINPGGSTNVTLSGSNTYRVGVGPQGGPVTVSLA